MKKKWKYLIVFMFIIIFIMFSIYKLKILYFPKNTISSNSETQLINHSNDKNLNDIWCATFQIAWEELKNHFKSEIIFKDENNELLNRLNNTKFGLNSISEEDYYITVQERSNTDLSQKINEDLMNKFNTKSDILNNMNLRGNNGIIIYSYLNKEYNFLKQFEIKNIDFTDNDNNEMLVQGFGISYDSKSNLLKNIKEAYYKDYYNFGISLNTKEDEEIILITTENIENEFEDIWKEYKNNLSNNRTDFNEGDVLSIPCINVNYVINYDELCKKEIKNADDEYIECALQNINFALNENEGYLQTEELSMTGSMSSAPSKSKLFIFNKPFVLFIKEKEKENPYFAIKIWNDSFLIKK